MTIHKLDKDAVEKLFAECTNQGDVLIGIYKLVFPNWDKIKTIHRWPSINKDTWKEIAGMFFKFDKDHHPDVMAGGLWMNNGFSTFDNEHLKEWEVDTATCKIELEPVKPEERMKEVFGNDVDKLTWKVDGAEILINPKPRIRRKDESRLIQVHQNAGGKIIIDARGLNWVLPLVAET